MLLYVYDYPLILASIVISTMAAFTGLALTRGLSTAGEGVRHLRIAMAAIALGGGIWTMHFVAMLAMRFDVVVYYRAVPTVASVLIAILLAGFALILMHFGRRTPARMGLSGAVLGLGIVIMHYVGLSGIEGCRPVYRPAGFVAAGVLAVGMGVLAIRTAYGRRSATNLLLATAIFGLSVALVHFTAMYWTGFVKAVAAPDASPALDNGELALVVMLSAFVICGAFLLSGASFLAPARPAPQSLSAAIPLAEAGPDPVTAAGHPEAAAPQAPALLTPAPLNPAPLNPAPLSPLPASPPPEAPAPSAPEPRLPYERDGATYFLPAAEVAAIRAEGHYTIAYTAAGRVFCPWSISEADRRLCEASFFRVHRSYLVNTARVAAFERRKDNGICRFENVPNLDTVPVSRSRVAALRKRLGL